jgi:hypothetical protein
MGGVILLAKVYVSVLVRHSMNIKCMSLEVHHVHQHLGTSRVAALEL